VNWAITLAKQGVDGPTDDRQRRLFDSYAINRNLAAIKK
jgi:hypothetical protein